MQRRKECIDSCFRAFVENGLENTGVQLLSKYCGFKTNQALYHYFNCKDQVVIECVDAALRTMEAEFMKKAPTSRADLLSYLQKFPKWAADNYENEFRLVYQVYTSPRYKEEGQKFFRGVPQRYDEYAHMVAKNLDVDFEMIRPMFYLYTTTMLHYILFRDDTYLKVEIDALYTMMQMAFITKDKEKS